MTDHICRHRLHPVDDTWLRCDICDADFLHRDDCPGRGTPECVAACAQAEIADSQQ